MKGLKFGVSYYPELVDKTEWERDLGLMAENGLSVIRMLDFAWTAIEPSENNYTFEWLDEFLELCQKMNFQVILCTPTATPPAWLATQFPEIMIERRDGTRMAFGGRRDMCVNSPVFRHFSRLITAKLADRYGSHPAIIGWQLDNEVIGSEFDPPECHCPSCQWLYRDWLKKYYNETQTLNDSWGTRFWNQEYSDWGEVTTPRNQRAVVGNVIDYARFFNASNVSFMLEQYDIIKAKIPDQVWISTNSTAMTDRGINHFDYHDVMDVAGWDAYFGAAGNPYPDSFAAFVNDMVRTVKQAPYIIFETNSCNIDRAYAAEMAARGGEAIVFWHWRMHRFNSEATAQAFCDHAGNPNPENIGILKTLVEDIKSDLPQLPENYEPAEISLIHCVDDFRAVQRKYKRWERRPYHRIPCLDSLVTTYSPFRQLGLTLDIKEPGDSLQGLKWAILPFTELLSREEAEEIRAFVKGGGVLFATGIIGLKDQHGVYYKNGSEPMNDVLGLRLLHTTGRDGIKAESVEFNGKTFEIENQDCSAKAIEISAEVLGTFSGSDQAAVFRHKFGEGTVYYTAACSRGLTLEVAKFALKEQGVNFIDNPHDDLAVLADLAGNGTWYFNYSNQDVEFDDNTIKAKDYIKK